MVNDLKWDRRLRRRKDDQDLHHRLLVQVVHPLMAEIKSDRKVKVWIDPKVKMPKRDRAGVCPRQVIRSIRNESQDPALLQAVQVLQGAIQLDRENEKSVRVWDDPKARKPWMPKLRNLAKDPGQAHHLLLQVRVQAQAALIQRKREEGEPRKRPKS